MMTTCAVVGMELGPGKYVALTITDPGVGMDERIRQRIFDPYFSTKSPGRGLGLSTVLGIVKGNDGALFVKSQEGLQLRQWHQLQCQSLHNFPDFLLRILKLLNLSS